MTVLLLALLSCCGVAGGMADWSTEVVASFGNHADLALDPDGNPHVAFTNCIDWEYCQAQQPPELVHAWKSEGIWNSEIIATDPAGFHVSILVDDAGDPRIAYCDSLGQMHYGYRSGGAWTLEDLYHSDIRYYRASPSLTLDAAGEPHIAFIERERVRYQHKVAGSWVDEPTNTWLDNLSARAAIAIDPLGKVKIGTREYYQSAVLLTREESGWSSEPVGGEYGYNPWMILDDSGASHFVFHGGGVHYATNAGGSWVEELVDGWGVNLADDIALDSTGRPYVIYGRGILISMNPYLYDSELFLAVRSDVGWTSQRIVHFVSCEDFYLDPRLEIDDQDEAHVLFRDPGSGELRYAMNPLPTAVMPSTVVLAPSGIRSIHPNPFNPSTEIIFRLQAPGPVNLRIFDAAGRRVRTLVAEHQVAGEHAVHWDGRYDSGKAASSGVYFCRIETEAGQMTRKMVLVR